MDKQSMQYVPATTGKARTFVIPGGARYGRDLHITSFMRVDSGSKPLGDITPIRINDPDKYNSYLDVGEIRGSAGRVTTQLIEKMPIDLLSTIDRLARRRIGFDVHVQFGECYDPKDIRQFSKGVVYEDATGTSHDNEPLVALDDGEDQPIKETLGISAARVYKYVPMAYREKMAATILGEITDVAIKRTRDCNDEDDAPLPMFAVSAAEAGSPSTGPYIFWSLDNGASWNYHAVDTLASDEDAVGVDVLGGYIIVISEDAGSFNYTEIDDFYFPDEVGWDPAWTELTTGLSDNPKAISSAGLVAFVCGDAGYVYKIEEPSEGAVALDEAEASSAHALNDIDALNSKYVVAVGDAGTIVFSTDGESFATSPSTPVGVEVNINAVAMRYEDEWWIGCDDGTVYMTTDAGVHWVQVVMPGTTPTAINAIGWSANSIGYIAGVVNSAARVWRTVCGGIKWGVQPQQSRFSIPSALNFNALAVSKEDVNLCLLGGLDSGSDGALVVGDEAQT